MGQSEQFKQVIKKMFGVQSLSKEQRYFLDEIFQEITGFLENPIYGPDEHDVLFSEVEIDQVFEMGGEEYCKISNTEYIHMKSRKKEEIKGDPVVIVQVFN